MTRPAEEAERLIPALEALGCKAVLAPMLEIVIKSPESIALEGVQAILITSANGARAIAASLGPHMGRDVPVLAVGEASAATTRSLGFRYVESAGGDVEALIALVERRCAPTAGRLLHAAGSAVAGDLKGRLETKGYAVERRVLYEARPIASLAPSLRDALADPGTRAVLFFSPRTAETFVTLVRHAAPVDRLDAVCLSDAVAEVARRLNWRRVVAATRPEQAALVDALADTLAARSDRAGNVTER